MRVDEAGQDGDRDRRPAAARASRSRAAASPAADTDDAAAVDRDPAVANRRRGDRQDPGGAMDRDINGRSGAAFFSAALRAA